MTHGATNTTVIKRYTGNPILSNRDIPYAEGLIYNGSVVKYQSRYVMLARVDHADLAAEQLRDRSDIALAFSDDGISWKVQPEPAISWRNDRIVAATDPRLMILDGRCYVTIAVQTRYGMETYCLTTDDFVDFQQVFTMVPDNRDVVLFPERINGQYWRIERPFPIFGHGGKPIFDMWLSESPDLTYWGKPRVLLGVDDVPYANDRVGAGTPPLRTDKGWLLLFHAVIDDPDQGKNGWEASWTKRYQTGVLLLDWDDPGRVIGMSREPVLSPETDYETKNNYRNNIVFPTGWVLEDSGEVKIYYGAADTSQCLATAALDDLLKLCL